MGVFKFLWDKIKREDKPTKPSERSNFLKVGDNVNKFGKELEESLKKTGQQLYDTADNQFDKGYLAAILLALGGFFAYNHWGANETKPDPSTNQDNTQISVLDEAEKESLGIINGKMYGIRGMLFVKDDGTNIGINLSNGNFYKGFSINKGSWNNAEPTNLTPEQISKILNRTLNGEFLYSGHSIIAQLNNLVQNKTSDLGAAYDTNKEVRNLLNRMGVQKIDLTTESDIIKSQRNKMVEYLRDADKWYKSMKNSTKGSPDYENAVGCLRRDIAELIKLHEQGISPLLDKNDLNLSKENKALNKQYKNIISILKNNIKEETTNKSVGFNLIKNEGRRQDYKHPDGKFPNNRFTQNMQNPSFRNPQAVARSQLG